MPFGEEPRRADPGTPPGLDPAAADDREALARIVRTYGGPVSTILLDPEASIFRVPWVDGAIGYRNRFGCAVAIGDPVCAPEAAPMLARAFHEHCLAEGRRAAYAVASDRFARWAVGAGYGAIGFGEELFFDPRHSPLGGASGRELRKKVERARREGVVVREYRPHEHGRLPALEAAMDAVAAAWLAERRGPQLYVVPVDLFGLRDGRRWFYASSDGAVVGVLSTLRLDAIDGHLLEHHLIAPVAKIGTSEMLVAEALRTFGAEGCRAATFGPAPARELGEIHGLGALSARILRSAYAFVSERAGLASRARYRRKFQVARSEPAYLLLAPGSVGLREAAGFLGAFHVSYA